MNVQQQVILDNYHNPQNFGKPENFTHHLRLENFTCGDVIEIFLTVKEGKVTNASFTGEGCSISIASGSLLTEEFKHKTVDEIEAMTVEDVLGILGIELTPSRRRCAFLTLEAAQKALLPDVLPTESLPEFPVASQP